VHDDEIIWESAAITIYLGETFGVEAGLWPAAGKLRGRAVKWVVWANCTLAEAASRSMTAGADTAAASKAKEDLLQRLAVLDSGLDSDFLLGDNFSLVDAHLQHRGLGYNAECNSHQRAQSSCLGSARLCAISIV
jgi:glutathione S-transferase